MGNQQVELQIFIDADLSKDAPILDLSEDAAQQVWQMINF